MAGRARRWIWRITIGLLGLMVVLVAVALLALANLDAGPVKRLLQGQAAKQGLAVDFDDGSVTLGALRFRNLRLLSPAPDRALAPALLTVGAIDGRWSPLGKRVDDLVLRDLHLTLVVDEDGTTSLDRLIAGLPPSEPKPPQPLSRLLSDLLPGGISARARVEGVTVTLIPRTPKAGQRAELTGLTLAAELAGGQLTARLGPGELRLASGERQAVARIDGRLEVAGERVTLALAVELVKQDLLPGLPAMKQVVDLATTVDFVPGEKRTRVTLERLALLDGAARAELTADLLDADAGTVIPRIGSASCRVDLVALARAVPPELGPLTIEAEPFSCEAHDLELLPAVRGQLAVSGTIKKLAWRDLALEDATVHLTARPDGDALDARLELALADVRMPDLLARGVTVDVRAARAAGAARGWPLAVKATVAAAGVESAGNRLRGARVAFDGTLAGPTALAGKAAIDVDRLDGAAAVERAHLDVDLGQLALADPPILSTGTVALRGTVARIAQPRGVRLDDLTLALDAKLGGAAPSSAHLGVTAARLAVPGGGADLPPGRLELTVDAPALHLDADPARSRGEARFSLVHGANSAQGALAGSMQELGWDVTARAPRLGPARALVLASKGSYGAQIAQQTTVEAGRISSGDAAARGAHLTIASSGTLRRQQATISAALDAVSVGGKPLGSPKLELTAGADLDASKVDVRLRGQQPEVDVRLLAGIDARRTVRWEVGGRVAKLASLAPLLPAGPDWNDLSVELEGRGAVSGVVRAVKDGVPVLVADPAAGARGKQSLELALRGVHWRGAAETAADSGAVTVKADAELGEMHHATVEIDVPQLAALASGVHVAVKGLTARVEAAANRRGVGKVDVTVRAAEIRQSAFAYYPVRDLELTVGASGDPQSALSIRARLANPGAGTVLELSGERDERAAPAENAVSGRHSFSVAGRLEQALDKLDGAPDVLRAGGTLRVPFRVESGDLRLFRVGAVLELEGASVVLPGEKLVVRGIDGELPLEQEIVLGADGPQLVGKGESGVYPQLRFSDQQPFLGGSNFLSIAEVRIGERTLGPIAGNARLDHDVLALDQLEMSALGGKITGQTIVEVRGLDTQVAFRGKVTGLRPTSGDERLDAHAAITMRPYRRALEGRIEIVRISRAHLLDLLDVWDPYHADVSANRIRLGLKIGYPKQVRLHFLHGFASLAVELGGLAGAVRIDEIRGIPIGPAMARFLAPVLETK